MRKFLAALTVCAAFGLSGEASFSYTDWTAVLEAHVDERGRVDYEALAKARDGLDRFLTAVERTSPEKEPALFPTREDRLAYYVNAYNAWAFRGVLARGPEKESVWKGGLVSGYSFFVGMDIVLGREKTNLKKIEERNVSLDAAARRGTGRSASRPTTSG